MAGICFLKTGSIGFQIGFILVCLAIRFVAPGLNPLPTGPTITLQCRDHGDLSSPKGVCTYQEGEIAFFDVLVEPESAGTPPEEGLFYTESTIPEGQSPIPTLLAIPGLDYVPIVVEFFEEWDYVQLEIIDDCDAESDEIFYAFLRDETDRADSPNSPDPADYVYAEIQSDDANYYLEHEHYEVDEGDTLSFSVCLYGKITADETVEYHTCPMTAEAGVDFEDIPRDNPDQIDFSTARCESGSVQIEDDNIIEGPELFSINITYDGRYDFGRRCRGKVVEPNKAFVTIIDTSSCIRFKSSIFTFQEGDTTGTASICLVREGSTSQSETATITYTDIDADQGVDYSTTTSTVTFGTTGAANDVEACFSINIEGDVLKEGSECFTVSITGEVNTCSTNEVVQVVIKDDDDEFYFEGIKYKVKESDEEVKVIIVRCGYLGQESTICVSTESDNDPSCDAQPGRDYTQISSQGVTFTVNQKSATVTIDIDQDNIGENDEGFYLTLHGCSSDDDDRVGYPRKTDIWIKNTFVCDQDCQNGGECVAENTCDCSETGYTGDVCDIPTCDPACVNGECIGVNVCDCFLIFGPDDWTGDDCNTPVCTPPCINGICFNNDGNHECDCSAGWYGINCNRRVRVISSSLRVFEFPQGTLLIFTNDLFDPTSARYIQLKAQFEAAIFAAYSQFISGLIAIIVTGFIPGSVIPIFDIVMDDSNTISVTDINEGVQNMISVDTFELGDSSLILDEDDPMVVQSQQRCPDDYCYNGGTCVQTATETGNYFCLCRTGYTGQRCLTPIIEEDPVTPAPPSSGGLSNGALIGIIVGSVSGLVLLILLGALGFWVLLRGRGKPPIPPQPPVQELPLQQFYPYNGNVFGVNNALRY